MFGSLRFTGILLKTSVVGKEVPNCYTSCSLILGSGVEMSSRVER
jgi:hypothetical protein